MVESPLIEQAQSLVDAAKADPLSPEERKQQAITLAALMLEEAQRIQTPAAKNQQAELAGMIKDPTGKVFTTAMTDQCFRSRNPKRVADQLIYLPNKLGEAILGENEQECRQSLPGCQTGTIPPHCEACGYYE